MLIMTNKKIFLILAIFFNAIFGTYEEEVVLGIVAQYFNPPCIEIGQKVLDIGAGDGIITKKLIAMAGVNNVWALEPDLRMFSKLTENIGSSEKIIQSTLQEAIASDPESFIGQFDVVTIFKYNVPMFEREDFFKALSKVIKMPGGKIIITSVEVPRFKLTKCFEVMYLTQSIEKYFPGRHSLSISRVETSHGRYDLAEISC